MGHHPVVRLTLSTSNLSLHLHSTWRFSVRFDLVTGGKLSHGLRGISLFIFLCDGIYCMFLSIGGLKHFAGGRPALVHSEWVFCLFEFFFLFAFSAFCCFLCSLLFLRPYSGCDLGWPYWPVALESSEHFYIHTFLQGFERRRLRCFLVPVCGVARGCSHFNLSFAWLLLMMT